MKYKLESIKKRLFIRFIVFLLAFILFLTWFLDYTDFNKKLLAGNVVFVLDLSNSMNVNDVFYNNHQVSRLDLAKKIIKNNINAFDYNFGLIIFADKFNYFIPPTKDKETFLLYLNALNTNYLNGGKTNIKALSSGLNKFLNRLDQVIILSDFDWDDLTDFKIKNYTYFIGIGTKYGGIVKNANNQTLFKDGIPLKSSLNSDIGKKLADKYGAFIKYDSYKKNEFLGFLKKFKEKNDLYENNKIDIRLLLSLILFVLTI